MNNITELVFILDASGSMYDLTDDTIGGFNSLISKYRNTEGEVLVSTVVFNSESTVIHDRVHIGDIMPLDGSSYCCNGCTALIDAIGGAVHHIRNVHRYARKEDVPERTLFLITTDGMENASRIYTADRVREMIKHEEEKYGWEFIFLGANIDSVATARRYGIREDHAVNYVNDSVGTMAKFEAMEEAVNCSICRLPVGNSEWRAKVDADFNRRGRKNR